MTLTTIHMAQDVGFAQHLTMPPGLTVEEIAHGTHAELMGLNAWVRAPEHASEEWIELPRHMWRHVRPKVDGAVLFGYRLHGDWLKSIFSVAAAILVSIAVPFLTPLVGATWAAVGAAAIGIGAQLLIGALFPVQQPEQTSSPVEKARQFANVESGSNLLAKESYLPIVVGTRRVMPPEIANPHYMLDQGVQTIQRIFALDGHHLISDIRVDDTPIADFDSITTEIRNGEESTSIETFVTKVTQATNIGETLSTFTLDSQALVDQEEPSNSEPQPVRFTTSFDEKLEEISIRLQFDSFIKSDGPDADVRLPVRVKFRPKGSTGAWYNLPEIHFVGRDVSTLLKEVRIRWDSNFGSEGAGGSIEANFFQRVPPASFPLSHGMGGDQWQAHAYFVAGSAYTDTRNVQSRRNSVRVTLSEDTFPKAEYEWEIVRGLSMRNADFNPTSYGYNSSIYSFFYGRSTGAMWAVAADQGPFVGRITASFATAIIASQPCQRPKTALIALRSKGQTVRSVTALASRFVRDWDGTGWNALTTSSNPAVHYRQILADYLEYHGISTDLIVESQFIGWRQECIDQGYEVSFVAAGTSVREVLDAIATAGFARARFSDGFGIDWFRDRSEERPVQTFSPRNASISAEWVFGEKPIGIRASFQNADRDFVDDEIQINNPFAVNFGGYDVRSYPSIAKPALVERRAYFDMLQAHFQQRRAWVVDCSIEGLICDRGDLIGLVTDLDDDTHSGARIRRMIDASTFTYDQEVPTESTTSIFGAPDIFDPTDIFTEGEQSLVIVTTPTGTEMRTIIAAEAQAEGWVIRVDQPFSSTDLVGAHFVLGPASRFLTRCIVSDVRRQGEERAQLVLVDEAPEIFEKMQERFGA